MDPAPILQGSLYNAVIQLQQEEFAVSCFVFKKYKTLQAMVNALRSFFDQNPFLISDFIWHFLLILSHLLGTNQSDQIWQTLKSLAIFKSIFCIQQNFKPTFASSSAIGQILVFVQDQVQNKQSSHLATLQPVFHEP